jgi:hypothetical protein
MGTKELSPPFAREVQWKARIRGSAWPPAWDWEGEEIWEQFWYLARERWAVLLGKEPGELDVEPCELVAREVEDEHQPDE